MHRRGEASAPVLRLTRIPVQSKTSGNKPALRQGAKRRRPLQLNLALGQKVQLDLIPIRDELGFTTWAQLFRAALRTYLAEQIDAGRIPENADRARIVREDLLLDGRQPLIRAGYFR